MIWPNWTYFGHGDTHVIDDSKRTTYHKKNEINSIGKLQESQEKC